jgi:membrane protein DedA with SNARE-associated domain
MAEFFAEVFFWIESLAPVWAYLVILAVAYGENVVPPVPGDMVVVYGGYLAGVGHLNIYSVWFLSTIGGALGFMTMYAVGYWVGDAVYDPNRLRWLPKAYLGRVRFWLHRWGYRVVLANRFLSGARSVISLSVGMAHMHRMRVLVYATVSAFVWTGLIGWAGYLVGENWEVVSVYLRGYGWFILALTAGVVVWVWLRAKRRAIASAGEPAGPSPGAMPR